MKILVAEDDAHTREGLLTIFEEEGFQTVTACDGEEALERIETENPDFVCLDIMMPKMNGYDVCREIRKRGKMVPVIFISAKSEEIDKVLGLELGADDFIMKPFGVREVVARIRAVTRRCLASRPDSVSQIAFQMGDLEVLPGELRARRGETVIDLSLRDIKVLKTFYENEGKALDRDTLLDECWGIDYIPSSRALASDSIATVAFATTHLATAAAALVWILLEWVLRGKATILGAATGAVAGLVGITPAAGFVDPCGALFVGGLASAACYFFVSKKEKFGYDDSLDAFGVHGVGGTVGAVLTGVFCVESLYIGDPPFDRIALIKNQIIGVGATIIYAFVVSYILLQIVNAIVGLRVDPDTEESGLDINLHGEGGYTI